VRIALPDGRWQAEWIDTKTGAIAASATLDGAGSHTLSVPGFIDDIALRIVNVSSSESRRDRGSF
jgi:hypothetical protein